MFHDHHYHYHYHNHNHHLPCLQCYPHSYIRLVQNLIERCLLLRMNRDDCVTALVRHASIHPLVTVTVWKELQKENRDFFHSYLHAISPRTFNYRPFQRVQGSEERNHGMESGNSHEILCHKWSTQDD